MGVSQTIFPEPPLCGICLFFLVSVFLSSSSGGGSRRKQFRRFIRPDICRFSSSAMHYSWGLSVIWFECLCLLHALICRRLPSGTTNSNFEDDRTVCWSSVAIIVNFNSCCVARLRTPPPQFCVKTNLYVNSVSFCKRRRTTKLKCRSGCNKKLSDRLHVKNPRWRHRFCSDYFYVVAQCPWIVHLQKSTVTYVLN